MEAGRAITAGALASMALACAAAQPTRARVALRCQDPGAEVTVDGVPRGLASDYTGNPGKQLLLPAGSHRVVVRAKDGAQSVRELTVGPEDWLTVAVDLPPPPALETGSPDAARASRQGGSP